jgi:hypothetical protein
MRTVVRWLLTLTVSFTAAGCEEQRTVTSTLSIQEATDLDASLARLDSTLSEHSPFISAALASPATTEQLTTLRSGIGNVQVDALEKWFEWHNGGVSHPVSLLPLGQVLSISESLKDREMMQTIPFVDRKRKNAVKLLDDGAGDGFFLDVTSKQPRVFYHMLEDPYPRDYGTMVEFVRFIAEVHAADVGSEDKSGRVVFDFDRDQAIESKYLNQKASR